LVWYLIHCEDYDAEDAGVKQQMIMLSVTVFYRSRCCWYEWNDLQRNKEVLHFLIPGRWHHVPLSSCLPLSSSLLWTTPGYQCWPVRLAQRGADWFGSMKEHTANEGRQLVARVNSQGSGHLPSWLSQTLYALIDCDSFCDKRVVK